MEQQSRKPVKESALLHSAPAVIATYDSGFSSNVPAFAAFARSNARSAVLIQLGYEHETPERAARLAGAIGRFREDARGARAIVLCNGAKEVESLGALGVETRLIQQNCFLDERRYYPIPQRERPFDAAYIARFTPCKRHQLVPPSISPRLLLLGCATRIYDSERPYAEMVYSRYAGAGIVPAFAGARISEYLALAKCGLVLSEREGASFCSSEYFLCGLPVVDTPSPGGRETLYPEEYVQFAEASEGAVGAAIAHWVENPPDPFAVRKAWLAKAAPHRAAFRELMRELTGKEPRGIPHKLGLRTPHPGPAFSIGIAAWLRAMAVAARCGFTVLPGLRPSATHG